MSSYWHSSNNIRVYPTAFRGQVQVPGKIIIHDPGSRFFTEDNATRPYVALCDYKQEGYKGSFVISETIPASGSFEFVIAGYYFKIVEVTGLGLSSGTWYARIKLNETAAQAYDQYNTNFHSRKLDSFKNTSSLDTGDVAENPQCFVALQMVTELEPGDCGLLIAQNGEVPAASRIKFESNVIHGGNNKPLSEELHTSRIYLSELTASQVVVTDSNKKLVSKSFVKEEQSATSATGTSFTYVDTWSRDADGDVTTSRKTTTITSGTYTEGQGKFKVNETWVSVYNLGTTGTPKFKNLFLEDDGLNNFIEIKNTSKSYSESGSFTSIRFKDNVNNDYASIQSVIGTSSQGNYLRLFIWNKDTQGAVIDRQARIQLTAKYIDNVSSADFSPNYSGPTGGISQIDLGRSECEWNNLYLKGNITHNTATLTLPTSSGTLCTASYSNGVLTIRT